MKLLLFDIDGTLLVTRGLGRRSVTEALSELCGRTISTDGVSFSGKTDPQIVREILRMNGVPAEEIETLLPQALARYMEIAKAMITPGHVHVLPGAADLLTHLSRLSTVRLGLVTGNLEVTAYLKLRAAGLDAFFPFGAFGSDHHDRTCLPAIAVRRAWEHTGHTFAGRNVVIIGDTHHDIHCGRGIGAVSVGVCTGQYTREDLEPHDPDVLLDDLRHPDLFVRSIL